MSVTAAGILTFTSSKIASLTPPVSTGPRKTSFALASGMRSWADRPDDDIDREFTVDFCRVRDVLTIGRTTDQLFVAEMQITIGHTKYLSEHTGEYRKAIDVEYICRKLMDPVNYATDCCLVIKTGESSRELTKYWLTTLLFEITYVGTAIGQ